MDNFDTKIVEDFVRMVREIVIDVIKNNDSNTERYYNGIITYVSDDGKFASVDFGDKVIENLPNKTGEPLTNDSYVRVYTTTHNMTNAYIGVKLN